MTVQAEKPKTPEQSLREAMDAFGVSRKTAIALLQKSVEVTLQIEGELTDEKVNLKMAELFMDASRSRAPWYMDLMQGHYRKRLPGWIRLNDEAHEKGWDAVTAMSVTEKVIVEMAEDRIKLVRLAKEGKTIEEITEAGVAFDDGRSVEELYSLIIKQMG